jgi:hypothetical protein
MRRFVLGWKKRGLEQSLGTRLVTYADDLVILCRRGSAEKALQLLRRGWVRAIFGASVGIAIRGIRGISRKSVASILDRVARLGWRNSRKIGVDRLEIGIGHIVISGPGHYAICTCRVICSLLSQ